MGGSVGKCGQQLLSDTARCIVSEALRPRVLDEAKP